MNQDKATLAELYDLSARATDASEKQALLLKIENLLRADPNSVPEGMMDLGDEGSADNPIRVGPPNVVSNMFLKFTP